MLYATVAIISGLSAIICLSFVSIPHEVYGEWVIFFYNDGTRRMVTRQHFQNTVLLGVIATIVFFICLVKALLDDGEASHDTTPVESDEERYARKARELRALKDATQAETELLASAIEHARTKGQYDEIDEVKAHEKTMRRLQKRLR